VLLERCTHRSAFKGAGG